MYGGISLICAPNLSRRQFSILGSIMLIITTNIISLAAVKRPLSFIKKRLFYKELKFVKKIDAEIILEPNYVLICNT